MNVLELCRQLLACDDPYAPVIIGDGIGYAETVTKTIHGVLVEPVPPVMAEARAAHEAAQQPEPPPRDEPVRTTVAAVHVTGRDDQAQHDSTEDLKRWTGGHTIHDEAEDTP